MTSLKGKKSVAGQRVHNMHDGTNLIVDSSETKVDLDDPVQGSRIVLDSNKLEAYFAFQHQPKMMMIATTINVLETKLHIMANDIIKFNLK